MNASAASLALEQAALDTGVIVDAAVIDPSGLYQRSHEAGTDSVCIAEKLEGKQRFAVSFSFAEKEFCAGRGQLKQAGDNLIMRFDKSGGCIIIAQYDGDRIAIPGTVDVKCEAICTDRGSMAGVALPRVSAGPDAQTRDRAGEPLCPSS